MAGGDADSVAVNDSSSQPDADSNTAKSEKADTSKAGESGEEVVVIQDTGFNISIVAPGVDPFDLPVCCLTFYTYRLVFTKDAPIIGRLVRRYRPIQVFIFITKSKQA